MPGTTVGVYTGELTAGTEVSSTYEGRHVTVLETELIHPFRVSGFVNKGDPVIICNAAAVAERGNAVGVALSTATALTDYIAVDTEGIWNLTVFSYDDMGLGDAIVAGDPLFIHDGSTGGVGAIGTGDATISKRRNNATQIPFGYALGAMVATGTGQVAVKVHWDPIAHWLMDDEMLYFGEGLDVSMRWHEHDPHADAGQGVYMALIDGWTCPGTGDYFVLNVSSSPTLIAGAGVVGIAAHVDLLGTLGQMGVAVTGQLAQPVTNAVTGFLSAGRFIFRNASVTCATAESLYLVIRNTAAAGFGGVAHSFIRIHDESAADRDCQNLFNFYTMDATKAASATELICQAGAANAASHVIKIVANGVPYWIMMDSTPPA